MDLKRLSYHVLQGNLFLLALCTHEVPLYLSTVFCSCASEHCELTRLERGTHSKLYPVTLNIHRAKTFAARLTHTHTSLGTRPSKNRKGGSGKQGGVEVYIAEC